MNRVVPILIFSIAFASAAPLQPAASASSQDGLELVRQGRYREARPLLERAVKAEPKNAAAHYALGLVHLNSDQDFEKAAACLEKAVALDERNAEYHFQLGVAYGRIALTAGKLRQIGLAAKVKRQGLKSIELDPRHIEARNGMIQFYTAAPGIMGGSKEEAREQAAEVARLDPYQGELSWALIASSERNSAELEKRYKAALALNPDGWQALQSYGSHCLRRNRADEALAMFERLMPIRPDDPRSLELMGDALAAKSREAEALQSYDKALSLRPDYDPVVFKLARFHERKGDAARAADYYGRYLALVKTGRRADQARARLKQRGKKA
jgi:tetratricopeptide (TPR) repeat protein